MISFEKKGFLKVVVSTHVICVLKALVILNYIDCFRFTKHLEMLGEYLTKCKPGKGWCSRI